MDRGALHFDDKCQRANQCVGHTGVRRREQQHHHLPLLQRRADSELPLGDRSVDAASVSVSGRNITITTADKPTSNPLQSRHDTLVVTVEFGGSQYALNVLMEQVTARQVTVDSVAITMSPIYYEFPNADATKLFTVSGKLHQGEITYYSDGTENSNVQVSDYAIDLTGGGVDIALYDKEFADGWTTSVQNTNQIAACASRCYHAGEQSECAVGLHLPIQRQSVALRCRFVAKSLYRQRRF